MANEEDKSAAEDQSNKDEGVDITKSEKADDADPTKNEEMEDEEEPTEEDLIRHMMFETDNWEDCITESVWYGKKIPQKRRHFGRAAFKAVDPVAAFFEDFLTIESCKERLIMISDAYMEASSQHN